MVEKGRREGHKDQKARERREQEEDDREGQKRRERTRGLLGGMSKKKPDEVCLQLARSLEPALEGDLVPLGDYVPGYARWWYETLMSNY